MRKNSIFKRSHQIKVQESSIQVSNQIQYLCELQLQKRYKFNFFSLKHYIDSNIITEDVFTKKSSASHSNSSDHHSNRSASHSNSNESNSYACSNSYDPDSGFKSSASVWEPRKDTVTPKKETVQYQQAIPVPVTNNKKKSQKWTVTRSWERLLS